MAETKLDRMSFEQMLSRLDNIVRMLEQGDAQLEQSLSLYTEGTELIRACVKKLDEAEQTVTTLQKGPDGAPRPKPIEEMDDDEYYGICSGI